ncbi:DUF4845 domain-containing protein [Candidatus Entotheonella palauensis]|uniref:DUF4845 domain-containing protein n=1 Tax=Candidatus Entotheonella gemina TaxID=1429439 RepID=W4M298_9BACT|nr:DUF4845 domain-containing protein [Candidatus Entotheonella palauensis]ETX04096.1 MAG: hypothetical protein ETSY2_30770 [Candidatus Entotheonella gemina]
MHTMKDQYGSALITVLLCIVIFGGLGFVGIKLAPIYIEHFGVASSLESMENEGNLHGKSKAELQHLLSKRLQINDVHRVDESDIEIKTKPRMTTIRVAYEVQVPLMSNVDFLVTFEDEAVLR